MSQEQLDGANGDSGTRIPAKLLRPFHWPVLDMHKQEVVKPKSPVRYTPTAEFETQTIDDTIQHSPHAPVARNASATPVNEDQKIDSGTALQELVGTLCKALRKYKKEEESQTNRVKAAQQMLIPAEALQKTLGAERFLPTLLEDYIETLAGAGDEAVDGFEDTDKKLYQRVIKRGRQLYAYYPELAEAADPANARFITDEFPFTLESFTAEVNDIVYSHDGFEFFGGQTRELIDAELTATVPRGQDEEKTKLARLGGLVGEMDREMSTVEEKLEKGVARSEKWLNLADRVNKLWEKIEPWLGTTPDS